MSTRARPVSAQKSTPLSFDAELKQARHGPDPPKFFVDVASRELLYALSHFFGMQVRRLLAPKLLARASGPSVIAAYSNSLPRLTGVAASLA